MSTLTGQVKARAREIGFDAVGIVQIQPSTVPPDNLAREDQPSSQSVSQRLWESLKKWLSDGFHGTMTWMARDPKRRSHPEEVLPGCRSIILVGLNYWPKEELPDTPDNGRIARYAWGKDYHAVMLKKLGQLEASIKTWSPDEQTRSYVDTGPVMEKPWAQEAGLGWIGKHTNLVSTEFGSWLLLGEILTTIRLDADEPGTDLCGSCSLCIQACPTGAIVEPYRLDAERCISYLTIEYRGSGEDIPADLKKGMGNKIFGCDDCLDICPFNVQAKPARESAFLPQPITNQLPLTQLSHLSPQEFKGLTQGSPLARPKYDGFMRNVRISLENRNRQGSPTATR
jgi:epoxyqueuosine reductase